MTKPPARRERLPPQSEPDPAEVLTRAVRRATEQLGLSQNEVSQVLGISPATMSRFTRGRLIDPGTKEGELALYFLRVFRSLDALVGGDREAAQAWLRAPNRHLDGTPAELVQRVDGLVHVVDYLDAMRGKL